MGDTIDHRLGNRLACDTSTSNCLSFVTTLWFTVSVRTCTTCTIIHSAPYVVWAGFDPSVALTILNMVKADYSELNFRAG